MSEKQNPDKRDLRPPEIITYESDELEVETVFTAIVTGA
jgi:hypothetical protein